MKVKCLFVFVFLPVMFSSSTYFSYNEPVVRNLRKVLTTESFIPVYRWSQVKTLLSYQKSVGKTFDNIGSVMIRTLCKITPDKPFSSPLTP